MCAIAGAFNVPNASYVVRLMLMALQHRGQQAAGILSCDKGTFHEHRAVGLIDEAFKGISVADALPGMMAIGHTRYSTEGDPSSLRNVQPMSSRVLGKPLAIVHNGNVTDYRDFRVQLEERGAVFQSDSDTELFLHLTALSKGRDIEEKLHSALQRPSGAWSLLFLAPDAMYATVDPYGFRPLIMAEYGGGFVFASESNAFDLLGIKSMRSLERGDLLKIATEGVTQSRLPDLPAYGRACSFEHIYFTRPDSYAFGASSGKVRERTGQLLAASAPADADLVIPVPDSSNTVAKAYARALGLPFEFGLVRNHYMGRTFTTPDQQAREFGVRVKLNAARYLVEGRRVAVVDDSIVRGTTSSKIVDLLRDVGATEVHLRIGSPPVVHPCRWGIDTPDKEKLIATKFDAAALAKKLGADSLAYLSVEDLRIALGDELQERYCLTCFTDRLPHEAFVPAASLVRRS